MEKRNDSTGRLNPDQTQMNGTRNHARVDLVVADAMNPEAFGSNLTP